MFGFCKSVPCCNAKREDGAQQGSNVLTASCKSMDEVSMQDPDASRKKMDKVFTMCDVDRDGFLNGAQFNWMSLLLDEHLVSSSEFAKLCEEQFHCQKQKGPNMQQTHDYFISRKSPVGTFMDNFDERINYAKKVTEEADTMFNLCNAKKNGFLDRHENDWMRSAAGLKVMSEEGYTRACKAIGANERQGWTVLQLLQVLQMECEAHANLLIPNEKLEKETPELAMERCKMLLQHYIKECCEAAKKRDVLLKQVFEIVDHQSNDQFLSLAELNWFHKGVTRADENAEPYYTQEYFERLCKRVGADSRRGLSFNQFVCVLQYNDPDHMFTPETAEKLLHTLSNIKRATEGQR